jgi:hypothetical protein
MSWPRKADWLFLNCQPNKDWAKEVTWEEKSYPGAQKIYDVGC